MFWHIFHCYLTRLRSTIRIFHIFRLAYLPMNTCVHLPPIFRRFFLFSCSSDITANLTNCCKCQLFLPNNLLRFICLSQLDLAGLSVRTGVFCCDCLKVACESNDNIMQINTYHTNSYCLWLSALSCRKMMTIIIFCVLSFEKFGRKKRSLLKNYVKLLPKQCENEIKTPLLWAIEWTQQFHHIFLLIRRTYRENRTN